MKRTIAALLAAVMIGGLIVSLAGCDHAKQVDQAQLANKKAKQDK